MAAAHNEATAFEPRVVVDGAVPALARGSDRARPRGVDRSADG
jgi:hypothetical protein